MNKLTTKTTLTGALVAGVALLLCGPAAADSSYSFPSVVEGPATVLGAAGERESVEARMPILVGDRLWVPYESRLEIVLADRSLLRIEGDSEIAFEAIAYSAETGDRATVLEVREGHLQLVVPDDALGDALPRLVTPDATIYVHDPGTYRVTVSRRGWTELVVRDGRAEIAGEREASLVYAGDMAVVEGGSYPRFEVRLAGRYDDLERWGDHLTREAELAYVPHVDRSLHYAAAPLASHGAWVSIGHRWAWRPRVAVSWQPYGHGYWRSTPIGLTWVSHDPWGYVTHHYGLWDYVPGYGWVWYPGSVYRPAWVHWYWGPSYVGWCPSGYYASYYGHHHSGISFGIYGWAGGGWHRFEHWSFVDNAHFGDRHLDRHVRPAREMARLVSETEIHKGLITSDPGRAGRDPAEVFRRLRDDADRHERASGRPLPDVSDFVARRPLAGEVREAVQKPRPVTAPPARTTAVSRQLSDISPRPGTERRDEPGRGTVRPRPEPRDIRDRAATLRDRSPAVTPRDVERPREPARTSPTRRETLPPAVTPRDLERYRQPARTSPPRREPPAVTPRDLERYRQPARTSPPRREPPAVPPRDLERYREPARTSPPRRETSPPAVTPRDVERYREPARTSPPPRRESPAPTTRVSPSPPPKPAPPTSGSETRSRLQAIDRASEPGSAKKPRKKDN